MIFSKETNGHEVYTKIMHALVYTALTAFIVLLILKFIFDFTFLDYIHIFARFVFLLGLVVGSIPDFLEKNAKSIIWDIVIILIMITTFFII
ncbi:hypothetical protein [Staphylococcus epidermidis]|uniref:hypothetical protein n=1 Tax=Staphylococcus epidermidis TaxID=1282 RepID=UPI0026592E86|nr:hypothetical protein [Staphylococcus epidermidis]